MGYTLYVGTPGQERDFAQYLRVREDAERLGMPLIVWAYPRGAAVEAKGGRDSFYAVDYAARTASELGADMIKVNFPQPAKQDGVPDAYRREISPQEAITAVARSANRSLLLVSGGERAGDEAMLEKARHSMEAGATGSSSAATFSSAGSPSRSGWSSASRRSWPSTRRGRRDLAPGGRAAAAARPPGAKAVASGRSYGSGPPGLPNVSPSQIF